MKAVPQTDRSTREGIVQEGRILLDQIYFRLQDLGQAQESIEALFTGLCRLRCNSINGDWDRFVTGEARQHPLMHVLHQDPFTKRAFDKPCGYAGDAQLIDFIYHEDNVLPEICKTSDLGRAINSYTSNALASRAVRNRRDIVGRRIDGICAVKRQPHILSVACGHLREARLSHALRSGLVGRFVALDHDPESLKVVSEQWPGGEVETLAGTVRNLIIGRTVLSKFDYIYATGLFDYLQDAAAQRLLCILFAALKPGGQLLIANFLPNIFDAAYMEAFMDWKLIYRGNWEMEELLSALPQTQVQEHMLFVEDMQTVVFLEVTKQ